MAASPPSAMLGADHQAALLDLATSLLSLRRPTEMATLAEAELARALPGTSWRLRPAARNERKAAAGEAARELERVRAGETVLRKDGRAVVLPLGGAEAVTGYLFGESGSVFAEAELRLARSAGELAGLMLETARALRRAQRRAQDAAVVEAVAQDLGGSLEMTEIVERLAQRAYEVVERPVVVWLLDDDRVRAVARAGGALVLLGEERSLPPAALAGLRAQSDAGGAGEDRRQQARRLAHFGAAVLGGAADGMRDQPGRMLVPLVLGERLIGYLAVGPWGGDAPTRWQKRLLHRVAPHAASAIENARLHSQVRRLSLTDPLVQLPNRRQLDLFLEREFAAAKRGRPLCFVLFDLDHFKRYNDSRGHRAGDLALIRFADVLRQETRSMNLAARYGGEEFAAVLSSTSLSGGLAYAERVRRRLQEVFAGELTVSAGVAPHREAMASAIDLVVAADGALYRAKQDGRNRVCSAEV